MPNSNSDTIEKGFAKAKRMIAGLAAHHMAEYARFVTKAAYNGKTFLSFTGNAENAIYAITMMQESKVAGEAHPSQVKPLRGKIAYNEKVYLKHPVEGEARAVRGSVDIEQSNVYVGIAAATSQPVHPDFGTPLARTRYIYAIEYGTHGEKQSMPMKLMRSLAKEIKFKKLF